MTPIQEKRQEFYDCAWHSREAQNYLKAENIDLATLLAHAGAFAVCLVKFNQTGEAGQRFEFSAQGEAAAVVEALSADGGSVMDLVAWPCGKPSAFATALGEADMLGAWNMIGRGGQPLQVHRTPLSWAKAGCTGCSVLNAPWGGYWLHRAGGPFVAEDIFHGDCIKAALGNHAPEHQILVPSKDERRAA